MLLEKEAAKKAWIVLIIKVLQSISSCWRTRPENTLVVEKWKMEDWTIHQEWLAPSTFYTFLLLFYQGGGSES